MKRDQILSCLCGSILALLLSFTSTACLVCAFSLQPVSMAGLFVFCLVFSVLCSLCFCLKSRWVRLGGMGLCVLCLLFWSSQLLEGFPALLYWITKIYDAAYGCGILGSLPTREISNGIYSSITTVEPDLTPALCAIAALVALVTSRSLCRGKAAFWAVTVSLLPLCACLVVTDTLPESHWLFLLLLGLTLLILTAAVRRQDPGHGTRLTAILVLPATLMMLLLFWAVPKQGYQYGSGMERFTAMLESLLPELEGPALSGLSDLDYEDLSDLEFFGTSNAPVMSVRTSQGGTLYLRARSLNEYDGSSWSHVSGYNGLYWPNRNYMDDGGTVEITTRQIEALRYVPYYSDPLYTRAYKTDNADKAREYSYRRSILDLDSVAYLVTAVYYSIGENPNTQLPDDTAQWAVPLAEQIAGELRLPHEKAMAIINYVRRSAEYDLDTPSMPRGEDDFARWFLEESDTGFCVHFATAATVLLRAAGIPARYVTGYMVQTKADGLTQVRDENAHAWVEAYIHGVGWIQLEPTPASGDSPVPPETTEPEVSTAPTEDLSTRPTAPPTEEPTHTQSTRPSSDDSTQPSTGGSDPVSPDRTLLLRLLKYTAMAVLAAAALLGQWRLRILLRRRRLSRGDPNRQALALWRHGSYLARLLKQPEDAALYKLAEKARYSQHTLTPEELALFHAQIRSALDVLKQKPLPARIFCRFILALY